MPSITLAYLADDDVELHDIVDDEEDGGQTVGGVGVFPVVGIGIGEYDVRQHQQHAHEDEGELKPSGARDVHIEVVTQFVQFQHLPAEQHAEDYVDCAGVAYRCDQEGLQTATTHIYNQTFLQSWPKGKKNQGKNCGDKGGTKEFSVNKI